MSRRVFGTQDLSEAFQNFLSGCARFIMLLGGLAALTAVGLLVFTCFKLGTDSVTASQTADAIRNVEIFQKILVVGVIGLGVGSGYLYWGSEILGVLQLLGAAALYFAPLYLPGMVGDRQNDATSNAYNALQLGGLILGIVGIVLVLADVAIRIHWRVKLGVKADSLKYGKGIKEDADRQNILLGKCWQLPFCRKFVRDRCPIYLSKRTCWKELVGCMCEESVIRNAMENKPIPKDAILAANFIPHNHKLTMAQKKDRCYSCVIYNEHQKHKYKVMMPAVVIGFIAVYAALHGPLVDAVTVLAGKINAVVNHATIGAIGNYKPPQFFVEGMLAVFWVIGLTYAMKVVEFMCFKLKV